MRKLLEALAEKGWRPHAGQLEYLMSQARVRILACGRRWGKTEAAAAAIAATIFENKRSAQMAIAPTQAQARIVFDRVLWMLAAAGIFATYTTTPFPKLTIKDGDTKAVLHVLDARSGYDAKHLRGFGADNILMDEAAFLPESLVTEVVMPILAADSGRMTLISTPNGKNYFYRLFQKAENGEEGFWSRSAPSSENPKVDENFLTLQKELLTENAFKREYLAEFIDADNSVFRYEDIQAALSAPKIEKGRVVVGVDWARARDYTAVVACRGTRSGAEMLLCKCWNRASWPTLVGNVATAIKTVGATGIACDKTGVGDAATGDLERAVNCKVEAFDFTNKSKRAIVNDLAWMLEKNRLRLLPDVDLIQELETFACREGGKYAASTGHDDRVIALALACRLLPKGGPSVILGKTRS